MRAKELHTKLIKLSLEYFSRIQKKVNKFPEYKYLSPDEKHSFYIKNFYERSTIRDLTNLYFDLLEHSFKEQYFFIGCISSIAINEFQKRVSNEIKPWLGQTETDVYIKILEEYNEVFEYYKIDDLMDIYYISDSIGGEPVMTADEEILLPYFFLQDGGNLEEPIWFSELKKTFQYLEDQIKSTDNQIAVTTNGHINKDFMEDNTPEYKEFKDRTALLFQLGIIDFLKNSNNDPNITNGKIAKVLSKITGIKESTLRKYINSSCNRDYSSDDVYNEKTIGKARKYLLNIDYEIKK